MADAPIGGFNAAQALSAIPQQPAQSLLDMYDPYNLEGPAAQQYHQLFDPGGAEALQRTANFLASNPNAAPMPSATQAMSGPQSGSEPGFTGGGQPITAGAAPAFVGQDSGNYPGIFNPRAPSTGWFDLNDYYRGAPAEPDNPAAQTVPRRFQAGSNNLSTNDWRLLPPQYRSPNYFQANGQIIDRTLGSSTTNPSAYTVMGQEGAGQASGPWQENRFGGNETGSPRISWSGWDARTGWPGQLGGWSQYATGIT